MYDFHCGDMSRQSIPDSVNISWCVESQNPLYSYFIRIRVLVLIQASMDSNGIMVGTFAPP